MNINNQIINDVFDEVKIKKDEEAKVKKVKKVRKVRKVKKCACGRPIDDGDFDMCEWCDDEKLAQEYHDGKINEDGEYIN